MYSLLPQDLNIVHVNMDIMLIILNGKAEFLAPFTPYAYLMLLL